MKTICCFLIFISLHLSSYFQTRAIKTIDDNDLCEIFRTTNQIKKHNFIPTDHKKVDFNNLKLMDSLTYFKLNNQNKSYGEKNYIYGQIPISKNRLALICYNKTRESDDNVYYFSLHIIDSCSKVKGFKILSLNDKHSGVFYEWTSSFNKSFDILSMTLRQTSEWVLGTNSKIDTMFTDIYRIDLKSNHLDTLSKTSTFKPFKRKTENK